jgi:hypothetical protein
MSKNWEILNKGTFFKIFKIKQKFALIQFFTNFFFLRGSRCKIQLKLKQAEITLQKSEKSYDIFKDSSDKFLFLDI